MSLELIKYELGFSCAGCDLRGMGEQFCIDKIKFFRKAEGLERGCLYLMPDTGAGSFIGYGAPLAKNDCLTKTGSKQNGQRFPEESALLLCGPGEADPEYPIPYIRLDVEDVLQVYNRLQDIFHQYSRWQCELQKALDEEDLQGMVDCSVPIFHNRVNIFDANYHQMAEEEADGYPHGDIPRDTIDFFKSDRLFNEVRNEKGVFAYPPSILSVTSWCRNIFYHNEYYCRIVVSEDNPCPPYIGQLLDFFAGYVEKYVVNSNRHAVNPYGMHLEDYLKKVVVGEEVPWERFGQSLAGQGWFPDYHYILGYVLLSKGDYHNKTSDYYCRQFMREYPAMRAFTMEDHIVFVLNCQPYKDSVSDFMAAFSYTIREGNFRVGFSNLFQNFGNLKYYYRQARIAVLSSLHSDETIWCHYFSQQALPYILQEACKSLPPEYLCARELLLLREYDRENNGDYFHTLQTYLDLNRNAVQTAKALFIHHATMVYRLKRLRELVNIDFTNTEQVLYLQLSFRLLEKEKA